MNIQHSISLKPYNTFGIEAVAEYFTEVNSLEGFREAISFQKEKRCQLFILGGGSNILLTKNIGGLVVKNMLKGIEVMDNNGSEVMVKVGAGENWHGFVQHCVNEGLGGVENLSLIPGSVGASPMQNIGAYGVEIKDVFVELEAINIHTGELRVFSKQECAFGYRESVFKNKEKGNYMICSVSYSLSRTPQLNTSYGAIEQELALMGVAPSIKSISEAVIRIRSSKLPDPKELGNAGSFFKNPVVSIEQYQQLHQAFPSIVAYDAGVGHKKLAAGWLIEQVGLKGKRFDNVGVHANQALVLVNYGGGTGKEIFDLSERVISEVRNKFNVALEREVNIV